MKQTPYKSGFTLVEIIVVVGIIGLLAAIASLSFGRQRANSRNARRVADLKNMQTALDLYQNDNGKFPVVVGYSGDQSVYRTNRPGGVTSPMGAYIPNLVPNYLRTLPIDPLYDPAVEDQRGYLYVSYSGLDYAFIAHGTPEGTWTSTHQFYDSVRYPGNTAGYLPSWKISTPGYNGY